MNLADYKKQYPIYESVDDDVLAKAIHEKYYSNLDFDTFAKAIEYELPKVEQPKEPERTFGGTVKDIGIAALKSAVGVPQAVVGLADLASGGKAGKLAEAAGIKFEETNQILDSWKSDAQKAADQKVAGADGFVDTVKTALQNPSTIANSTIESLGSMGVGGVIGKGIGVVAPKIASMAGGAAAGAIGEGVAAAGSQAESIRQQTVDGELTGKQSGLAALSGVGTSVFGAIGGKLAQKFGIVDIDTAMANGAGELVKSNKGIARRLLEGGVSEGVFEELPQSIQEQMLSNIALDKPVTEGVANAAAMGMLAGGVMGAGAQFLKGNQIEPAIKPPTAEDVLKEQADYEAAQAKAKSDAALPKIQEATSLDEAIVYAQEAVNTPINTGLLNPLPNGALTNSAPEAIDAADILGDENVSNTDDGIASMVDSAIASAGDNVQASVGDLPLQPNNGGVSNPTETPASSEQGNVASGATSGADNTLDRPFAQATDDFLPKMRSMTTDAKVIGQIDEELKLRGITNVDSVNTPAERVDETAKGVHVGEKINKEWTAFSPESGTLNIPRSEMPQVKAEHRGAMVNFLNARGVDHTQETVPASSLKPTQQEFSEAKVKKASKYAGGDRSILVSSDNHVLDGHHQWLSKLNKGDNVDVIRLNAPIAQLLNDVKEFPSSTVESGATAITSENVKGSNAAPVVEKQLKPKAAKKPKHKTLLAKLRELGGVSLSEKRDVTGEDKGFAPGGYNQIFKKDNKRSLKGLIESGDLDDYLPYNMRLESNGANDDAFDSTEAYDYLADKIRNGESVLPYDTQQEIEASRFYESQSAQDDIDALTGYTDEQVNKLLQEAGYDERQSNAESKTYERGSAQETENVEQGITDSDVASGEREESAAETNAGKQAEVTNSNTDLLGENTTAKQAIADAERAKDAKRNSGNDNQDAFTLTGSNSEADQAAAAGAQDLFAPQTNKTEVTSKDRFADNKVFTADKVAAARARLKSKLGNINSGIDPELLIDGMTIAGAYIESGVRSFSAYSKAMVNDFGDSIKPYLLSFYEAARAYPDIDKEGMTSAENAAKEHQALLTPAVKEQAKEVIGQGVVESTKAKAKPNGQLKLTQDWGVDSIDGWTDNKDGTGTNEREDGVTNGVKEQFLNESKKYLTQVSKLLEAEGYEAHKDQRGRLQKAVSVSESGIATSGEVSLTMRKGNAGVYVDIGTSAIRGLTGNHPQGVSVMIRATGNAETDRYATKGQNIWLSTDLNATELANKLMQTAERYVKNTEQVNEDTQNARANQAGPVLTGGAQNDLLTEQPRGSDSEPLDAGMAGSSEETTGNRNVSGSATQASRSGATSTSGSNRNESPSRSREASDAGNTTGTTNDVDNFSITSDTVTGEGSASQKYRNNVEAIKLIKKLDAEKRIATPEERETLAKYAGFGALSGVFDKNNTKFSKEYAELKELLTPEEYDAARASILNAYFTSPTIVKNMFDAVSRLGFKNGRVLEPSMGSGNFFGMMPASMRGKSDLNGVELDVITSRLAKYLYPKANIAVATGFQNYDAPEGYFDLVISNPPFGSEKISDNAKRGYSGFSIHNYFIAKSIDKLREGGVMAVVVSHSFMDAQNSQAREWISKRANLLGAVRLPKEAFKDIAGTEVITDILYFQKTATPEANPTWLNAKDNGDYSFNEYFYANPRNVLGRIVDTTSQFGKTYTIESVPTNGTMQQLLKEFNERLPQGVYVEPTSRIEVLDSADSTVPDGVKVGTFYKDDKGNVRQRMPDLLGAKRSQAWESPNAKATERMLGMMDLRDLLRTQMRLERDAMASTKEIEANRSKLNKAYDAFLKQYGFLNSTTNRRLFMDDTESALVQALEMDYDAGVTKARALSTGMEPKEASAQKADIFNRRVLFPPTDSIVVNNAQDALLQSLDAKGRVDVDYMAEVYNKPINEIVAELGDVVMNDPTKGYVTADEYLSGDVKTKLAEAKKAALTDGAFQRNVEALEKVIPKDKLPSEIFASAGANWIPADVYEEFAAEITGVPKDGIEFNYVSAAATWVSDRTKGGDAGKMTSDYGTGEVDSFKLFGLLINGRSVEVKKSVSNGEGGTKSVVDVEKTDAANAKYQKIKEFWNSWIFSDPARADRLAAIYNEKHNRTVARKYDGSHMNFYGMSPAIKLIQSQKNVVWRAIQDRNVLFDHVVGAGKTFAMAATAMEMKRLGISRKPMFVVPNHLTLQWRSEFTRLYPASNILAATPEDFAKDRREKMFSKMVTGGYDAIIIGHSSLKKVGLPAEIEQKMYAEQVKEIAAAIESAKSARGDRGITRDMEKIKTNLEEKIKKLKDKAGEKDNVVSWDELSIDGLFIDEMHEFKNLFFTTQMQRTSGLGNPSGSGKALDLFMKVRFMQETRGENVPLITATGTPVSNSLAEMFTMQRYMKYDELKRSDLHLFDAWAKQYGEVENVYEVAPSGVGYRQSTRFSKFKNLPSLMASYTSFADVITLQDLKDQSAAQGKVFPVPKIKSGKPINVIAQRSTMQRDYFGVPKLAEDAEGNIQFDIEPSESGVAVMENGKWRLSFKNGFQDFETEEQARLELVTKSLTPKTFIEPESLLGKFANLAQLTRDTKGKINALSLTGLANKAGLDYRIIDPSAPDFEGSKINIAVGNMTDLWKETAKDKGTQIVFCDMSVPASARAGAASKERYALVRDRNNELLHKKATLHTIPEYEGFPFYIVQSGKSDNKSFAVYEPLSGLLMREGFRDKDSAKSYMAGIVDNDRGRDSIFAMRDRTEIITKDDIDEYFAEQEQIEIADDGGNLITPEDLESIAGSSQFSVYDDIKAKLIARGVPEVEIAFIHDYNTPKQKEDLFKRVNRGEVRFLFGSTPKLGAGTNVQKRLVGLHHIDAPWRPSDLEQREGRIIRQGNELYARDPEGFEVAIYRYATEQTYDTRRWQLLEHKAAGIEQLRKYSGESEIEDVATEASNSADMKAAASGNPLVLEETKLRTEVKRLQNLEKAHIDSKFAMGRKIKQNESSINDWYPAKIAEYNRMIDLMNEYPIPSDKDKVALTIVDGQRLTDKEKAENAITQLATRLRNAFNMGDVKVINYRGIDFTIERGMNVGTLKLSSPDGTMHNYLEKDNFSAAGLFTRFNNYIDSFDGRIKQAQANIASAEKENAELKPRLNEPFDQAELLKKMQARHDSVKRKLMKSTQLEAVPENQRNKFNSLLEQRRNQLIEAGYEDVLKKAEAEDDDVPMFSRNEPFFSLGTGSKLELTKSKAQFGAKVLNKALVKYFGNDWSDSFESVDVPDTLLAYKEEVKVAFGKELRYVSPTNDRFDIFAGVQLPKSPNAIYVNARAETNLTTIAGHELYHTLERTRPDLHQWFKQEAQKYIKDFGVYHENLNKKLQDGEKPHKTEEAMSELLADFTGDALSDVKFLQELSNADGNKFKGLLNATIRFLNQAILKLKNLASSRYITDVEALRDKLKAVLLAFANGNPIDTSIEEITIESEYKGVQYEQELADAERVFLSNLETKRPNDHFKHRGRATSFVKGTEKASRNASFDIDGNPEAPRLVPERLGKFSEFTSQALITKGFRGESILEVEFYGKEQEELGATDAPAIRVTLTEDGELTVYGADYGSETFSILENKGWASEAKQANGVASTGTPFTRLDHVTTEQIQLLLGDVHARALAWGGVANTGMFWNRATGATGGVGNGRGGSVYFSRQTAPQQGRLTPQWADLNESKIDSLIYTLQDKQVDLKRVTQAIKDAGNQIDNRWNAYLQEELYHGRTAKRTQDFIKDDLEPLIEDMRMRGVSMADFEEYLWMRHAEERNIQIAKVNPEMPDGGSGVSTQEANDYLTNLPAADKSKYEALAKRIDLINRKSRQVLLDYGLEDVATIKAWEGAYKNYVPLMREDMDMAFGNGTGQGFSVKGNASKRATGSNRAVVDIIANIAQQYEKNIIRGEKNRVSTALIGLAKLNPNESFWQVDTPPTLKTINKATGLVETRTDPNYKNRDNVVVARIRNRLGRIEERSVVFSQFDERAMRMAASIKNLDQDQMGELLGAASSFTRYFASINTQYNPVFGIINITRDVQGALLNLSTTPIANRKAEVLKNTGAALLGIYQDLRSERKTGQPANNQWSALFEEFQREGGQTGYRDMFRNAKERGEALKNALDPTWWQNSKIGKVISLNGAIANQEQWIFDKAIKPIFDWLSDYNNTLENAVRLSVYKVALDNGSTKQEAASLAKNISVNFNRKGEMGRQIGSLYAFFNASVQGSARIGETLARRDANGKYAFSKTGKRIIQGGILLGSMQALLLAAAGYGDDDPPEFLRNRSLIIPMDWFGLDNKYITIPMPLGFNAIPAFGRITTEWALSGGKDTQKRIISLMDMLLDVTNPIGNAGLSMQTLAPTLLDPVAALAENKDFTNRPIYREDFNSLNPTPGYTRSKDKAWAVSVELARFINLMTGGTDYKQGAISPTADQIEYLVGQFTGGVGREVMKAGTTVDSLVSGEDLPPYKIPLVGRFYGNASGQASQGAAFYQNVRELNEHEAEIKGRRENGEDVASYIKAYPEARLAKQGDLAMRQVNALRKRQRQLKEGGASRDTIKKIDERITVIMTKFNERIEAKKEARQ